MNVKPVERRSEDFLKLDVVITCPCVEQKHLLGCSSFILCSESKDQLLDFIVWMFPPPFKYFTVCLIVGGV